MSGDPSLNVLPRPDVHLLFRKDDTLMYSLLVLMSSEHISKMGFVSDSAETASYGFLANFITALFLGTKTVIVEDLSLSLLPRPIPLA